MYLRDLRVQNVKLLRDVHLDFTRPDGQPRMWTVFVGENRLCKTTLLQTIAAVASGRDQAVHLTTGVVASWPDLRRPEAAVKLEATFGFSDHQHTHRKYPRITPARPPRLSSSLTLENKRTVFEGESRWVDTASPPGDPLIEVRALGLPHWFVAAYGTRRMLRAVGSSDAQLQAERFDPIKPLFGEELIGMSFIELLVENLGKSFAKTLQKVFVAGELLPHVTALELRGRGGIRTTRDFIESQRFEINGVRVPATWMSQGYQSMIAWIADVVGHILLEAGEHVEAAEMEGCVLVDEIDLHLHPTWQVRLIPALKKVFPRLQFIATTHSPMMLPALAAEEVYLLTQDAAGSVVATPSTHSPALLTGSELYQDFFGLSKLYPNDLGDKTQRYGWLANDPMRTDEEHRELLALRAELAAAGVTFDWEPVAREVLE